MYNLTLIEEYLFVILCNVLLPWQRQAVRVEDIFSVSAVYFIFFQDHFCERRMGYTAGFRAALCRMQSRIVGSSVLGRLQRTSLSPQCTVSVRRLYDGYSRPLSTAKNQVQADLPDSKADPRSVDLDAAYQQGADALLQILVDKLETPAYSTAVECVDLSGDGVLEIILANGKGTIVLNKHYVYKQIWYSAPHRTPDYFDFNTTPPWTSQRTAVTLQQRLATDILSLTGVSILF